MRPAAVQKIFSNEAAPEKDAYKASRGKRQGYFAIRAFLYKIRIITAAITGVLYTCTHLHKNLAHCA